MEAEITAKIEQLVAEMMDLLEKTAVIQVDVIEEAERKYIDVKVKVEDEGGAELIGHHGSVLESIATVLNSIVNAEEYKYTVLLDINGYRDERSKHIREMTQTAVDEALSTGQAVTLDPMKPWERKVVHLSLAGRTDIVTESQGEEPSRQVVIKPTY